LHFVRDGSASHAYGRCIGQTDLDLSVAGRRECRLLARNLPLAHAVCISSDLQRARSTASMLSAGPVIAEPRLREMHFGEWDGRTWAEIEPGSPDITPPWPDDWTTIRAPGGESFDDVVHRVTLWLEALPRDGGDFLIVGHAGSIRAAAVVLLGIPASRAFALALDHASVSTFELTSNGASLIRWNAPGF
jgi:broad specificity phosphatase PhoE